MTIYFKSKRIIFIKPEIEFAEFYANNMNDPEIYRWISSNPRHYSVEEEGEWIKSIKDEPVYTMISRYTKEIIGNISFNEIKGDIGVIGIWITTSKQNKHYGKEAIESIIKYGQEKYNIKIININVFENNIKAVKCYKNIGFKEVDKTYGVKDGIGEITNDIHMTYKI